MQWVIHARSNCVPSHCFHYWHSGPVGLTAGEWFHSRSSYVSSHRLNRKWVIIPCQVQLYPFLLSSLPVFLTASEWFHGMFNCPFSALSYSYSIPVDLKGSEWIHARFSYVSSHCPHSGSVCLTGCECQCQVQLVSCHCFHTYSGPVGLIASGWFHARSSCVPPYCPHYPWHSSYWPATVCEWFYARSRLPALCFFSLPLWSCWTHRE